MVNDIILPAGIQAPGLLEKIEVNPDTRKIFR
jgi:hypothetical protein